MLGASANAPRSVLRQGSAGSRKGKKRKHRFVSTLKLHNSSQSSGMMALREQVAVSICLFAERLTQGVSWLHSKVPGAKKIVFSGDTGQSSPH